MGRGLSKSFFLNFTFLIVRIRLDLIAKVTPSVCHDFSIRLVKAIKVPNRLLEIYLLNHKSQTNERMFI